MRDVKKTSFLGTAIISRVFGNFRKRPICQTTCCALDTYQIKKSLFFGALIALYSKKMWRHFFQFFGVLHIVHTSFTPRSYLVWSVFMSKIGILASTETEIFNSFLFLLGINKKHARLSMSNTEIKGNTQPLKIFTLTCN